MLFFPSSTLRTFSADIAHCAPQIFHLFALYPQSTSPTPSWESRPPLCLPACPPSRSPLCLLKYAFIRHAKEEGRRQPSLACGQTAEPGSFEVCKPWQTVHSRRDLTELPLKKVSANCSANSTGQAVNTGSDNCQLLLQWRTAGNAQGKCKSLTNVVKEQIKFTKLVNKLKTSNRYKNN